MASNLKIGVAARDTLCNAFVDLFDVGGAGKIMFFTGAVPTNPSDADPAGTLVTINLNNPAFEAAGSAGSNNDGEAGLAGTLPLTANASASGDAASFRMKNNANTVHLQGTAGESADTPDIVFTNKTVTSGQPVNVTGITITFVAQ